MKDINILEQIKEACQFLKNRTNYQPEIGLVLGSGLGTLAEQIEDDVLSDILKEQVAELERQKQDIDELIIQKEKKSKGLLRLFGLFG